MKYSVLMPYCRRDTLHNTLVSFVHHYGWRHDYEVIVIEDSKNVAEKIQHDTLVNIVSLFAPRINIKHIEANFKSSYAPCRLFNLGAHIAGGDYLVLTDPECFHLTNVLAGFDVALDRSPSTYVVAACINASYNGLIDRFEDFKYEHILWYQHSLHRNRKLHFCSVVLKKTYSDIGGFDEGYAHGYGRDDVDFLRTLIANDVAIATRDDIVVVHMDHAADPKRDQLWAINKKYYAEKWGS